MAGYTGGGGGGGGGDADAIHDNVAGEILAIAAKAFPVSADLLLIEDSADASAKKRLTLGTLRATFAAPWAVVTESTAARSAADGEFILISASTCVITLPAPSAGIRVACKVTAGTVTSIEIRTSGAGVDIDGTDYSAAGLALTAQYEQINLISDGTDWFIY